MRTFLFVAGTTALLIAVFAGYWWMQPPAGVSRAPETVLVPVMPESGDRTSPLGRGENAGVMMFDPKTGELSSVFDAAEFEPIGSDQFRVVKPVALFYLKDRQRIRIRGEQGVVWLSGMGASGGQLSRDGIRFDRSRPPSRGQLKNVVIDLFEGEGDIADLEPVLTVNLDNAGFDNDTYRIFTEDAEINGVFVPADQMPITARGRDYEFDGRGLVIQWNEADRRLDLLRIAHGERLVIRNPKLLAGRKTAGVRPLPLQLVSTDPSDAAQALPLAASADRYTVYRAVFDHAVRISQDGKPLAIADNMVIDVTMQSGMPRVEEDAESSDSAVAQDAPATASPTEAPVASPSDASAGAAPSEEHPGEDRSAAVDAPGLSESPIVVEWAGPLVITPAPETDAPPPPREAIVRLTGNPVQLAYDGHAVEAGLAVFETARTGVQLEPVAGKTLQLRSADGQTLETTYVRGRIDDSFVVLGPGASTDPVNQAGARWTDHCAVHLVRKGDDRLHVESAELVGNVKIEHPSLELSADKSVQVALADSENTEANKNARDKLPLRHMRAEGNVVCLMTDSAGQAQRVQGDLLELETEVDDTGRRFPRRLAMEGNVLIEDATRSIRTRTLSALLNAAPAGTSVRKDDGQPFDLDGIVIEKIDASGGVQFQSPDGQFALAESLVITEDTAGRHLTLIDENGASIGSGSSTLSGREISLHEQSQQVGVSGAGSLETVRVETDGYNRPITVEWQDSMNFDARANTVVASGDIVVLTTEADGTVQTITGETLSADLVDRAKPADDDKEADDELTAGMARKGLSKIRLTDNVEVRSLMSDESDAVLRRLHVTTPGVEYDAQTGTMLVPSAGRLLYEDHRKNQADTGGDAFSSPQGTIAMSWAGQARFVQADGQVAIEKDVVVVYQADADTDKPAEAFRIDTPRLVIDMAADSSDEKSRPELKRVVAEDARFAATDIELQADRLVYDHGRKVVIVSGTDAQPVEVFRGAHAGRWQSLTYDVEKDRIVEMTRVGAR